MRGHVTPPLKRRATRPPATNPTRRFAVGGVLGGREPPAGSRFLAVACMTLIICVSGGRGQTRASAAHRQGAGWRGATLSCCRVDGLDYVHEWKAEAPPGAGATKKAPDVGAFGHAHKEEICLKLCLSSSFSLLYVPFANRFPSRHSFYLVRIFMVELLPVSFTVGLA